MNMCLGMGMALTMMRGRGGSAALAINGLTLTGTDDGDAVIWTTVTPVPSVSGNPDTVTVQWLLDGSPMQGATGALYIDPEFDGVERFTILVTASKAGEEDVDALFGPVDVRYPEPVSLSSLPEITGTVGDAVDIDLAAYFSDLNPSSSAAGSLSYAVTAGALPAGLSIVSGRIQGTLLSAVEDQAVTITASNSGGAVALATTSTVLAGDEGNIIHLSDYQAEGDMAAWFATSGSPTKTLDAEKAGFGTYGSIGAMIVGGESGSGNLRIHLDISAVAVGETITIDVAAMRRILFSSTTVRTILRTENAVDPLSTASGTTVTTLLDTGTVTTNSTVWATAVDQRFEHVKVTNETRLVLIFVIASLSNGRVAMHHLKVSTSDAIPTVNSVTITSQGKIGEAQTAEYVVTPPGTSVTLDWRVNGVSQGASYTPVAGDNLDNLTLAATPTGGVTVISPPVVITYPPPVVTTEPTVTPTVEAGGDLVYTLGEASNATASFVLTIDGVVVASGSSGGTYTTGASATTKTGTLNVTYTNSGDTVFRSLPVTVTGTGAVGEATILYEDGFGTDRAADFDDPSVWTLIPYPFPGDAEDVRGLSTYDPINGAMQFSVNTGGTSAVATKTHAASPGDVIEVLAIMKMHGGATHRTTVQFLDGGGAVLATTPIRTDTGPLTILTEAAPANTASVRLRMELRSGSGLTSAKGYVLNRLRIAEVSESGASPELTTKRPTHVSPFAYVGRETLAVDFTGCFSGTADSYGYEGPETARWDGPLLYLTPSAEVTATENRKIYAYNGALRSGTFVSMPLRVYPAASALEVRNDISPPDDVVEVDRPMTPFQPTYWVTGGVQPFTCSVISKPSWVIGEDHNNAFSGMAPGSPAAAANLTVRVTDQTGAYVDVTQTITVIATRSRTPYATISPTSDLAAVIRPSAVGGRVFQLEAGTYTMGNWFRLFEGSQANPIIVRGVGTDTIIYGALYTDECSGIIFENVAPRYASIPSLPLYGVTNVVSCQGINNRFYDIYPEGWEFPVADFPRPDTDPWVGSQETAYVGTITLGGRGNVVHNMVADKITTLSMAGVNIAFVDVEVLRTRRNGIEFNPGTNQVAYRVNVRDFGGNWLSGDHRDLFQVQPNNGRVHFISARDCFFGGGNQGIAGAQGGVQGAFMENDGFDYSASANPNDFNTVARANLGFRLTDCVFLAGSNYGMYFYSHVDCKVSKVVAVNHPDQTSGNTAVLQQKGSSEVLVDNSIYERGTAGTEYAWSPTSLEATWGHLADVTNSVHIVGAGATSPTTIFPNWANTGLAYEDPREAVANGQPASAARFWIDPAGAWSIANEDVGPSWLRTG